MTLNLFKKSRVFYVFIALIAIDIAVWSVVFSFSKESAQTALYFLNIGQGDSQLIQLKTGEQILVDAGPSGSTLLKNLSQILPPQDRYIDILFMTHPQLDHFGGFIDVLKNYEVGAFIGNGRKADVAAYPELHALLERKKIPYIQLAEGDVVTIGDSQLIVLSPSQSELLSGELNDTSLVFMFASPEFKALYTADIGTNVEARLSKKYNLDADILKVGHHGSRFSSGESFLEAVSPEIAVIGVGKNTYGHPSKQTLDKLGKFTSQVYRTDKDGIIKIEVKDGSLVANTE